MGGKREEKFNTSVHNPGGSMRKEKNRKFGFSGHAGQDLVEFGLVLPLLLLIFFGVLDLGRAFHASIQMANSARVGARFATLHPRAPDSEIKDKSVQEAISSGIVLAQNNITITCKCLKEVEESVKCLKEVGPVPWDTPCPRTPLPNNRLLSGARIRVIVNYDFDLLFGGIVGLPNIPIQRSIDMIMP